MTEGKGSAKRRVGVSATGRNSIVGWGSRRFARMEEGCIEKAIGGSFARTTRKTAEDEGRRRGRGGFGHDAKHMQGVSPYSRISEPCCLLPFQSDVSYLVEQRPDRIRRFIAEYPCERCRTIEEQVHGRPSSRDCSV